MKNIILSIFIALAACWQSAGAQTAGEILSLAVTTTDGATTLFPLSTSLTLGFTETSLTLTDSDLAIEIPRASLAGFSWSEEQASTEEIADDIHSPAVEIRDNAIIFKGLPQGAEIKVFNSTGQLTATLTAGADTRLPLSALPAGSCIIATPSGTFKIATK